MRIREATLRTKRNSGLTLAGLVVCLALWTAPATAQAQAANSCLDCHAALDPPLGVKAEGYARDIHVQKGLTCVSCHGGDPTIDDDGAMDPKKGFKATPKRAQIPAFCASCHADGAYMRQYNPSLRTDQLAQYRTSTHGKRLAQGDTNVAVCTDCHSVHGIRPARDPESTVHPLNVATTCARCHADAAHMKSYKIPTDQMAGYKASVHYEAMTSRGDLSAPTCSTCHGNHGAAPPGVASVEFVCSNCHVFQAQLFDISPHKAAFAAMEMPGCVTCHSNHRINKPSDAMIGTGPQAVCTNCHVDGDGGYQAAAHISDQLAKLEGAILRSDEVLGHAERSGMEISEAKLQQVQARDALTRARVTLHSFTVAKVDADIDAGLKVAAATHAAGEQALAERAVRRRGLGVSLIAIVLVLIALRLYIKRMEAQNNLAHTAPTQD